MYDVNDALSISSEEVLLLSKEMQQYMKINLKTHSKDLYPSIHSLENGEFLEQVTLCGLHPCLYSLHTYFGTLPQITKEKFDY